MPACVAVIEQVPTDNKVTAPPETVQTEGVVDASVTTAPDDELAETDKGEALIAVLPIKPNVIF